MKLLSPTFSFLILLIFGQNVTAQQKVYKVLNNPDGTPYNFFFTAKDYPNSAEKRLTLWGNLILTDGQGPSLRDNVFYTYTTAETDSKISALENNLTTNYKNYVDVAIHVLDSSFIKNIIDNIDQVKSQIKAEIIEQAKKEIKDLLKSELDKLRGEIEKQIHESRKNTK